MIIITENIRAGLKISEEILKYLSLCGKCRSDECSEFSVTRSEFSSSRKLRAEQFNDEALRASPR